MANFLFSGGKEVYFCSGPLERAVHSMFSHVPCQPDEAYPAEA